MTALLPLGLIFLSLTGCFEDNETTSEKYAEWKAKNERYMAIAADSTDADGKAFFSRIEPSWAPAAYSLIHWYNDRTLTAGNLSPMDNSTVDITYLLLNVDGDTISSSFASRDSVYTSKPSSNIIGVWYAMTQMHVGDSVQVVIPYQAGYGETTYGGIPPYSTLVYHIKMKGVTAYEVP